MTVGGRHLEHRDVEPHAARGEERGNVGQEDRHEVRPALVDGAAQRRAGEERDRAELALASGLGYAIWYRALPALRRTQAALVQLAVPPLAALGGVLLLGESFSARLAWAGALVLGGIALAALQPPRAVSSVAR